MVIVILMGGVHNPFFENMDLLENEDFSDATTECSETDEDDPHSLAIVEDTLASQTNLLERAVDHRPGFWSGHIFIEIQGLEDACGEWVKSLSRRLQKHPGRTKGAPLIRHTKLHVSLSRPFYVSLSNIESIVRQLEKVVSILPRRTLLVHAPSRCCCALTNDEGNRTFWVLDVQSSCCLDLTRAVDSVFTDYNLPKYYDPPKFHVSFASMPGIVETNEAATKQEASAIYHIPVSSVNLTFGTTKAYSIPLT